MKKLFFFSAIILLFLPINLEAWGFFAHEKINHLAVFTLPPQMTVFYKKHIEFITAHAVDADKRKFILPEEAPRHFIDIDHYGLYPYEELPRNWDAAVEKFTEDTLLKYGILPWHSLAVFYALTKAFKNKDQASILKLSADIGHYIADAHVPLHACTNYNGQFTGQQGIHALWESSIPELLADNTFNFWVGKATYINDPAGYIWKIILQSAQEAATVLQVEKTLSHQFPADQKYSFINRNGHLIHTYSVAYVKAYNKRLKGMVEAKFRESIHDVASFWYTAWVNAGQPDLQQLSHKEFSPHDIEAWQRLEEGWLSDTTKLLEKE
jgi:hypothetical protein